MASRPSKPVSPVAQQLTDLRVSVLNDMSPEEMHPSESLAIGRELNEWRRLLGRLHAVQGAPGRLEGWGILEPPPRPATLRSAGRGQSRDGAESGTGD